MIGLPAAFRSLDENRHRAEFYRLWHAGYAAAFTHPGSLDAMGPRASAASEELRLWLLERTKKGRSLAELVRVAGTRFEPLEAALLTLGEETGTLDRALRLIGEYFDRKHRLMLAVRKQLAYPIFTGLAATFIAPVPLLFAGHVRAYVVSAFGGAALLVSCAGGILLAVARSKERAPPLVRARIARALATGIEAGLPLDRALALAAVASDSPEVRAWFGSSAPRRLSGQSIVESLRGCPHLTPEFITMVDTAERTGDFGVVTRLAELYEEGFK